MRSIAVTVLGAGHVGVGVLKILAGNRDGIERRLGARVVVQHVLVRDRERVRDAAVEGMPLTTDAEQALGDPDVRVVIEVIGGVEPARTWVLRAMRAGKHVVTANKALLARHGQEIFEAARAAGVQVFFEAAVAGGVPLLRSLREGLASDRITGLTGIVNGTSNFVLDAMARQGLGYPEAIAAAQRAGYAEADPTLDVEGHDAAQKLALLALVSFGTRVDPAQIPTEGISRVREFDIKVARTLGRVIKHLAIARWHEGRGLELRVHPAMIPEWHVLAGVGGAYNAVQVDSEAMGHSLYYGPGAGGMATGVAVVSDLIEACRHLLAFASAGPRPEAFFDVHDATPLALDEARFENYVVAHVPNVPGVLGRVATCLGDHGVSIQRMNQDTPAPGETVDMVIITEPATEREMLAAIAGLDALPDVRGPTDRIRMLDPDAPP